MSYFGKWKIISERHTCFSGVLWARSSARYLAQTDENFSDLLPVRAVHSAKKSDRKEKVVERDGKVASLLLWLKCYCSYDSHEPYEGSEAADSLHS